MNTDLIPYDYLGWGVTAKSNNAKRLGHVFLFTTCDDKRNSFIRSAGAI